MSGFFQAKTTQEQKGTSTSTPTFTSPESQSVLNRLTGSLTTDNTPTEQEKYLQGLGTQGLASFMGSNPAQVDATGALNAIRSASDSQTQSDIVKARSQFYNRPDGRNQIAVADTIVRNANARDAALASTQTQADQFNANAQNTAAAQKVATAGQISQYQDPEYQKQQAQNSQLVQLLSLLRGDSSTSTGTGAGTSQAPGSELAGQFIGGALGGMLKGGVCWVARAAFGEDSKEWLEFRTWLLNFAPEWFLEFYITHGEFLAEVLNKNAWLKPTVRFFMRGRIKSMKSKLKGLKIIRT